MKHKKSTIALILVLLAGLSLMLYPLVSDLWNETRQSRAIADYTQAVAAMDDQSYRQLLCDAQAYNAKLLDHPDRFYPTEEEISRYERLLNVAGSGVMGYVEIPSIQVLLPIYHGVDEAVLQTAIGHIEGTSLPVGGESTHCVISGHRGLPSAELFTDLDQLDLGDTFRLRILDEVLTYEVDQIRIVEPDDLSLLEIEPGEDLCTLVTCTPYGVNSHRLLVRGRRVVEGSASDQIRITADAVQIDTLVVASVVAIPILLILSLLALLPLRHLRRRK